MQIYSLMQNSRGLRGQFFSLKLVQSLKKKRKAVPRVPPRLPRPWELGAFQENED